jgi:hypothetical protein
VQKGGAHGGFLLRLFLEGLVLEGKSGFGAGSDRVADAVQQFWWWFRPQNVELVLVVHVEHLGDESHADGVGLAHHLIDFDLHHVSLL